MKDNTVNANGVEVYTHDINYYADEYIKTELDIDCVDDNNRQSVSDSFVDMIFYIADIIKKKDDTVLFIQRRNTWFHSAVSKASW